MNLSITRPRALTLLACAVAASVSSPGCHTVSPKTTTTSSASGTSQTSGGTEPGGPKTEFHRAIGAEQEFNVHVELARFHETQGDNEAAVVEYQKASDVCDKKGTLNHAKLGPSQHSLAERRTGAALDRLGRFAQAEPHYLKALKLAPRDPKVWNDAGYSYYLQSRLADAERALKTADSLGPNNPLVLTNLGLTYAAGGKTDESLAAFTRAGGPAAGHANLGYILAAMGKNDPARQHYQMALKLQPELTPARQALAKLDPTRVAAPTALATSPPLAPVLSAPVPARQEVIPLPVVTTKPRATPRDLQLTRTSAPAPTPAVRRNPPLAQPADRPSPLYPGK